MHIRITNGKTIKQYNFPLTHLNLNIRTLYTYKNHGGNSIELHLDGKTDVGKLFHRCTHCERGDNFFRTNAWCVDDVRVEARHIWSSGDERRKGELYYVIPTQTPQNVTYKTECLAILRLCSRFGKSVLILSG